MANPKAKRERGRILTDAGWSKLDTALQAWEVLPGNKRNFERISLETQLDPGTIAKIMKRREGSDLSKLEQVFKAFHLTLEPADHAPVPQEAAQTSDPNFVGRAGAIADLNTLAQRGAKVIVIQARGGVGKTTLARKYLQQEFETVLEFPIAKETKDIASIESLIEEKLRQLGEEPGREFLVSIDRLKRKLQAERIGILIDNLEPALDSAGKFIEPHRSYVELLRVLADPGVRSLTLITSRERLNEYSISLQPYLLKELSLEAWKQFFQNQFTREFEEIDDTSLAALQNAYGGNAKAMSILCGAILTDYSGNIAAYWSENQNDLLIERALEDLVVGQFDRIQQLDPDAYKLLCRMGCYRYQDVPTVPIEGLFCLLWDVAENRQRRVVKALQERSLVEYKDGEFWLHPVIRGEAIGRLREGADLKKTNQHAADFWVNCVEVVATINDILKILESCLHHIENADFLSAGTIIFAARPVRLSHKSRLLQYDILFPMVRLGLLNQSLAIMSKLLDHETSEDIERRIYQRLGELRWRTGSLNQAIHHYQKSIELSIQLSSKDFEMHARLGIGVCKFHLGEFEEALEIYEQVNATCKNTDLHEFAVVSWFSLAVLNAMMEAREKADTFAQRAYEESFPEEIPGREKSVKTRQIMGKEYRSFLLGETYRSNSHFETLVLKTKLSI
jgi:tetratricopeptide (TPR) repeat protein